MKVMSVFFIVVAAFAYAFASKPIVNPNQSFGVAKNYNCINKDWCPVYEDLIKVKLTSNMLKYKPDSRFCPNWSSVDKISFWVAFEKSIMATESSFDNTEVFEEPNVITKDGKYALSIGLLQLSKEDQESYPTTKSCRGITDETLKDYRVNIPCGLEIQNVLISHRTPLTDYWSSLDFETGNAAETAEHMQANMPECF